MSQFPRQLTEMLSRLQDKLPDRPVGLVPADAFFTRKVDLPENLTWKDKLAYVELALEGNAPFPLEQLAWGFLESESSPFAFVYATPKSRLKRLEIDQAEKYLQLFPGFLTLSGESFPENTIRFISQNAVLSAVYLAADNPVPEKVVSRKITAELLTDDTFLEARKSMEASLETEGYTVESGLWLGEGIEIHSNDAIVFKHRHLNTGTPLGLKRHTLGLPGNALWAADLRDASFASQESNIRRRSGFIWKGLKVAAIAALFLLFFQLSSIGLSGLNVLRERKLIELEPQATRVENKLTLASRLTQSTEEDLKPFILMEVINPMRPDSIFFDRVRSRAYNQLEIGGQSADGVSPVNAFADSINQLEWVQEVENNSRTRSNQTSFDFIITFSTLPPSPEGGFVIPDEESEENTSEEQSG